MHHRAIFSADQSNACLAVFELLEDGDYPHCGCGPHVIHGVKVSALLAP